MLTPADISTLKSNSARSPWLHYQAGFPAEMISLSLGAITKCRGNPLNELTTPGDNSLAFWLCDRAGYLVATDNLNLLLRAASTELLSGPGTLRTAILGTPDAGRLANQSAALLRKLRGTSAKPQKSAFESLSLDDLLP